jgi:asparagine synthase (glutamine-hydrolysing)
LFITPAIAKQIFPKFLTFLDQPTIDGFNTFCVSQLAREQGTKVVLSGLGGDEIFGGYKSFQQVPRLVKYGRILQPFKPISKLIGQGLTSWSPQPQFKRLGEYLQRSPNTTNAMGAMRGIFTRSEAEIIAQKYLPPDTPFPAFIPNAIAGCPSLEDEVSVLELSGYMRNQLLHDSDVMSMAWGLELRVPFVDRVLLETVASIPSKLRLAPKKQILVNAIPELPTWVTNQPKRGFIFPFQQWFEADEEWNNYLPQVKLPSQVSIDLWYRRWNLTILDYWWQQNVQ